MTGIDETLEGYRPTTIRLCREQSQEMTTSLSNAGYKDGDSVRYTIIIEPAD